MQPPRKQKEKKLKPNEVIFVGGQEGFDSEITCFGDGKRVSIIL